MSLALSSGMSSRSPTEIAHPIHPALVRPMLFAGVEYPIAILEGTLVVALLVGVGLHLATIALAGIVLVLIHPVMAHLTAQDPHVTQIYLRSLALADYYAPSVSVQSRHAAIRPSVPRLR